MKIIKATREHLGSVYDLICQLENEQFNKQEFEKIYLENLANKDIFYYVAELDNRVVGFASLHIQSLLHHNGKIGELQELIISSEKRGAGIGKALLETTKQVAKKNGCLQYELCCGQKRTESHKFYEAMDMNNTHYKFTCEL